MVHVERTTEINSCSKSPINTSIALMIISIQIVRETRGGRGRSMNSTTCNRGEEINLNTP